MNAKKVARCLRALERFSYRNHRENESNKDFQAYIQRKDAEAKVLATRRQFTV